MNGDPVEAIEPETLEDAVTSARKMLLAAEEPAPVTKPALTISRPPSRASSVSGRSAGSGASPLLRPVDVAPVPTVPAPPVSYGKTRTVGRKPSAAVLSAAAAAAAVA